MRGLTLRTVSNKFKCVDFQNVYSLVSDRSRYVLLVDSTLGLMRGTTLA